MGRCVPLLQKIPKTPPSEFTLFNTLGLYVKSIYVYVCAQCLVFLSPPQLLNCIMDMVEKTRRSLTVLRRCQEADREELNYWIRRYSDAEELKKGATSGQSRQQSPAAQENATSGQGSHIPYSDYTH